MLERDRTYEIWCRHKKLASVEGLNLRLERDRNDEIQCRAADWNLSSPDWTGRMRVMEKNQKVAKTEDCHAFRAL